MNRQYSKNIKLLLFFVTLIAVTWSITTLSFAEEKRIFPGYPIFFNHHGTMDRVSEKEIVVGDMLFFLAPDVEFHTPDGLAYGTSEFKTGDPVGVVSDPDNYDRAVSVWLLKDK